jgi:hypothetical protein
MQVSANGVSPSIRPCVTSSLRPSYRCGEPCCASFSSLPGVSRLQAPIARARLQPASDHHSCCPRLQPDEPAPCSPPRPPRLLQRSAPPSALRCAALPLRPKLAVHHPLPDRSSCPTSSVQRAGTRGSVTFTCSRSATPTSALLLPSAVISHAWARQQPLFDSDPCTTHSTFAGLFLADSRN